MLYKKCLIILEGIKLMTKNLGRILKKLRKKQEISQSELSDGICSVTTLSRIEKEEREPDQLLFEALISRLGKDGKKWELVLSENDKNLLQKRNYIDYLLFEKKYEQVKKELEDYENCISVTEHLHMQYIYFIQGVIYQKKRERNIAYQKCLKGLQETEYQINIKSFQIKKRISKNELQLLYLLGEILIEEKKIPIFEIYSYWKELLQYTTKHCTDRKYRFSFYIKAMYYLAYIAYEQQYYQESFRYCQNAILDLRKEKSSYYLTEILLLIKQLNKKIKFSLKEFGIDMADIDILLEILEEWAKENKKIKEKEKYIHSYNGIYSINEIIKYTRRNLNKTQEDILTIDDNYFLKGTQTAVSEIENGKRVPRKEMKNRYLEELGIKEKAGSFTLVVQSEDFEIQELRWDIDFYISIHNLSKAENLLSILEKKLDLSNPYNEQYVRGIKFFIRNERELIPLELWKKEVMELLNLTVQDVEKKLKGKDFGFFTREELLLLMNLGIACHRHGEYEQALAIYEKLETYFADYYKMASGKIYKALLYNLSQVYGLMGNYEKSMRNSRICIFMDCFYQEMMLYDQALFNIAWCYGEMMKKEQNCQKKVEYKKNCEKFFRQSYCMAMFYEDSMIKNTIENIKDSYC